MLKRGLAANKWVLTGWLLLLTASILTMFTPLTFASLAARNACWLLAAAGAFTIMPVLAHSVHNAVGRSIVKLLPAAVLTWFAVLLCIDLPWSLLTVANGISAHWETVQITHRSRFNSAHVALQMLDVGARGYKRRTVISQPLTPYFYWVSEAPALIDGEKWQAVQEEFNPFGWRDI